MQGGDRARFGKVAFGRSSPFGFFTASRPALLNALEGKQWRVGLTPRRSGPAGHERGGQGGEQIGIETGGGEGQVDAGGDLDDAGGDLEQREAQHGELRRSQIARFRNGVADGEHQPVGGGVKDEANLVGERRAARRAIGGKLGLVQLDEILRLAARTIEAFVQPLG